MSSLSWLHNLRDYQETSDADPNYNCVAWAFGNNTRRWWPYQGYYWPTDVPSGEETVQDFVNAFESMGYHVCTIDDLEEGFEKIAIYARHDVPKHVAKQLPSGKWTSKLGTLQDIEHASVEEVTCALYGEVHTLMRRKL